MGTQRYFERAAKPWEPSHECTRGWHRTCSQPKHTPQISIPASKPDKLHPAIWKWRSKRPDCIWCDNGCRPRGWRGADSSTWGKHPPHTRPPRWDSSHHSGDKVQTVDRATSPPWNFQSVAFGSESSRWKRCSWSWQSLGQWEWKWESRCSRDLEEQPCKSLIKSFVFFLWTKK